MLAYLFKLLSVFPQVVYASHPNGNMMSLRVENLEKLEKSLSY